MASDDESNHSILYLFVFAPPHYFHPGHGAGFNNYLIAPGTSRIRKGPGPQQKTQGQG